MARAVKFIRITQACPDQGSLANLTIGNYSGNTGGTCEGIKQILKWVPRHDTVFARGPIDGCSQELVTHVLPE